MSNQPFLLFQNVHKVMKADRIIRDSGINCKVVPVPENISTECGMCLIVEAERLDLCREMLEAHYIQFEIHKQENQ